MPENLNFSLIADMVKDAERYRDEQSSDRINAQKYYEGIMDDLPSEADRSKVVMRVTRAAIQKAMASFVRTILGSDEVFEFQPQTEQEKETAQQQSDYINYVVLPESGGHNAIYDAIHDAATMRNGILYAYALQKTDITTSKWTGQTEQALETLLQDQELKAVERWEDGIDEQGQKLWGLRAKRVRKTTRVIAECVDPADFIVDRGCVDLDEAMIIGTVRRKTRSDLVSMGYDKTIVDVLPLSKGDTTQRDAERQNRRAASTNSADDLLSNDARAKELQEVDYYELFVRIDADNDGIAELHRLCFGGMPSEKTWLNQGETEADSIDFAELVIKRKPHQREGISLTDDLAEIQRIQSFFLRQVADNVTWQNNLMTVYEEGAFTPDTVQNLYKPGFGKVLKKTSGAPVRDAVGYLEVPFIAKDTFAMLDWFKAEGEQRSGVNDAGSGLDPDALQNQTATATALMEQGGIGQIELMSRMLSVGLERFGKILMRLSIKHCDKARTVLLRDKFVEVDPRQWNADLNCTVNTGLGAGTRERDLMAMQMVLQVQKGVVQAMQGPSPLVGYEHIANSLKKLAEAANLRRPLLYFGQPDQTQLQQYQQEVSQRPNPEVVKEQAKAEAAIKLRQMELEVDKERMAIEAEKEKHKEIVQSQAAVEEKRITSEIDSIQKDKELEFKQREHDDKMAIELLKLHVSDVASADSERGKHELERDKMDRADSASQRDRELQMAQGEIAQGEDGKPVNATHELIKKFMEMQSKPRRVVTPDGEEFTMEAVQ